VALIWPQREGVNAPPPDLSEVVETLEVTPKAELPELIAGWLDTLDASGRYALIKLLTGELRVGASARLTRLALAEWAGKPVEEIEEVWHGVAPPYLPLFRWLEGKAERPDPRDAPVFRPLMLAHPLEDADVAKLEPSEWRAEWKWDGIRVQLTAGPGGRRIWSRGGEDVSGAFPEVVEAMDFHAVLDGELLVIREDGQVAPFADLQQRLNRKAVTPRMQKDYPVGVRLYDLLFDGGEDLRPLPLDGAAAAWRSGWTRAAGAHGPFAPDRLRLVHAAGGDPRRRPRRLHRGADAEARGQPLRRGPVKGLWWKWKRDPLSIDAVMMYAQRGHGKRSSFYSDYTFGLWRPDGNGGEELVPVGKAYSGYTDQELVWLDRWIRNHTVSRFGPVREVEKSLVLEVIFDAAQLSNRHKSGVALRFPRILRIRKDKPAGEADRLENLMNLVEKGAAEAAD
jgi:DNA ligase-1